MPIVNIEDFIPGSILKEDLYHTESGRILMKKGESYTEEKVDLLESLDIDEVFKSNSPNEIADFLFGVKHKLFPLSEKQIGESFSQPLFDKKGRVLIEEKVALNNNLYALIKKSGGEVFVLKPKEELKEGVVDEFLKKAASLGAKSSSGDSVLDENNVQTLDKAAIKDVEYDFDVSDLLDENAKISSEFVDQDLAKRKKPKKVEIVPDAVLLEMGVKDPLCKRTAEYKATFNETYLALIEELSLLFENIKNEKGGNLDSHVKSLTNRVINTLVADKNLVINLTTLRNVSENYLVQHSLNVAVFAVNIGCALGYSEKQIYELAFGALMADLGMMKIDQAILNKAGALTPEERRAIERHPAYSLDYLNNIKGIPTTMPYIIYQSHEKLDASGYPKSRPSFLIHDYAKIIAIADIFDSLCTNRPWRKAYMPYKAMEEVIRMAGQKKLDGKIIRQWLFSISLFPVGSYVTLSDSSVSKVISANPMDFTRPNVRALLKDGQKLTEEKTLVLSDHKELRITHAVDQNEVDVNAMDGF